MTKQNLKDELKYQLTVLELIQNNKNRNEEFWDEEESKKTDWVLNELNEKIKSIKNELKSTEY